jgi:hypothetical protein
MLYWTQLLHDLYRLGKILWGPVPPDVREIFKRIWDYTDIKDIIVREHNVQPYFSEKYMYIS